MMNMLKKLHSMANIYDIMFLLTSSFMTCKKQARSLHRYIL